MKRKKNLKKLLNLEILDYTNITFKIGDLDMPYVRCKEIPNIDFIANYSQKKFYFKTHNTCLGFFEYDSQFDGLYGLWNGIYYGVDELQEYYKERFKGIRYFIAPDYSRCGDIPEIENYYRHFKSRIVSIWLTMNTKAVVIPLITTANNIGMKYMLDGIEDCNIVAFNTIGCINNTVQQKILKKAVENTVGRLKHLRSIVAYATTPDKDKVLDIFEYAINNNIEIQIPNNVLQTQNRIKGGEDYGSNKQ